MNLHRLIAVIVITCYLMSALALHGTLNFRAYISAGPLEVRFNSENLKGTDADVQTAWQGQHWHCRDKGLHANDVPQP